ncbi:hypothetical protein AAMO2058_001477300 [Amorphochlora amoebiformis]
MEIIRNIHESFEERQRIYGRSSTSPTVAFSSTLMISLSLLFPPSINPSRPLPLPDFIPYHQLFSLVLSTYTEQDKKKDEEGAEVFCVRFSPDSKYIAAGCGDGSVRIFNPEGKLSFLLNSGSSESLPTTAVRFRPQGNANGSIEHWHMTSRKRIFEIKEKDNQIYALDYSADGDRFASAGKDSIVRVYEEATKSLLSKFERGYSSINSTSGHSNRVYAVKFHPKDKNIFLSAGKAVRYIYGPHICGDALDVHESVILTGSWKSNDGLQLWELRSSKLLKTGDMIPEMLYAAHDRLFDVDWVTDTLYPLWNKGQDYLIGHTVKDGSY